MTTHVRYTLNNDIARVTLDAPEEAVNILNEVFLRDLETTARELANIPELRGAIVSSGKESGFIAGADIKAFSTVTTAEDGRALSQRGQEIFSLWANLPFPVVAAVHGHCMGGGTEFILACHGRILADTARISLPEVRLGILPGFGGTQRLPRLVGVQNALDLILSGRSLSAQKAEEVGLADQCVPPDALLHASETLLLRLESQQARQTAPSSPSKRLTTWLLEKNPLGRSVLYNLTRQKVLKETRGHYPAPLRALEVIREGLAGPLAKGLELEAQALGELIVTPECRNLVHVFFLSQRPKKGSGLPQEPRRLARVAVVGAGVMGAEIAQLMAEKGFEVRMSDIDPSAVEKGLAHARELFREKSGRGGEKREDSDTLSLLTAQSGYQGLETCDLVIEAVVENMETKQAVLHEVESHTGERTLFATNTSALSVSHLQQSAGRPERVAGMHFFNPVHRMPLVEIVRGQHTDDETLVTLFDLALRLGKTPILVKDSPGFLVNRLLGAYLNEACQVAAAGVQWTSLDAWARRFGLPMGPFRLLDEVGFDVAGEVGRTLGKAFSYLHQSPLLEDVASGGLLGRKGGKGFYLYRDAKESGPNREVSPMVNLEADRPATEADWRRLLLIMVNEAGRCLEQGVVPTPEDIDTGMVFGTGFPPFLGGLCRWADSQGLNRVRQELRELEGMLGERFVPCHFLNSHERFYA